MPIVKAEQATVYRGVNRRWLTRGAAYLECARVRVAAECQCAESEYYMGRMTCDGEMCAYHDPEHLVVDGQHYGSRVIGRLARWYRFLDTRALVHKAEPPSPR